MQDLLTLDRERLIRSLTDQLPQIREAFHLTRGDLERATGISATRIEAFEDGRMLPKWSEYLSIIFFLWVNDSSRAILEDTGLFPVELRLAFSVNRNAHDEKTPLI